MLPFISKQPYLLYLTKEFNNFARYIEEKNYLGIKIYLIVDIEMSADFKAIEYY
jgi:hypothetical protein